jgi:hypothetical protein
VQQGKSLDQIHTERRRGWILKILDEARPDPMELAVLTQSLDALNFPLTRRWLARELDFLRSGKLLRVFPMYHDDELSDVEQAKLIQRYANSESDGECGNFCARITAAGINFQAGLTAIDGIARVE